MALLVMLSVPEELRDSEMVPEGEIEGEEECEPLLHCEAEGQAEKDKDGEVVADMEEEMHSVELLDMEGDML